ncbi:MAG: response regulator [Chloroflexota bacterium]|jgi:DNA-binding response OmpR family regulator
MKQILVIEDDRDLSLLFKMALEMSLKDVQVDVIWNGTEGMRRLDESLPDAIVLDMHLPGVSGDEIYKALERRREAHRVLVCSADVRIVNAYTMRGINAVEKPIPMAELTSRVSRILDGIPVAGGFL